MGLSDNDKLCSTIKPCKQRIPQIERTGEKNANNIRSYKVVGVCHIKHKLWTFDSLIAGLLIFLLAKAVSLILSTDILIHQS